MKPFLEVEKTRQDYHALPFENTVHRSSLLVPFIDNTECIVTFLNHFLLKRGNLDVVIKISCINKNGYKLRAQSFEINEKKVYAFNLTKLFEDCDYHNFIIEFFSSKNLFIPFPAVIINHIGKDFCNVVHSYNRILNDIFEDDSINKVQVAEASFDVLVNNEYDTFINFASGIHEVDDKMIFKYDSEEISYEEKIEVKMPRLSHKTFYLSDLISTKTKEGTIKIVQPKQSLFFGRILAGIKNKQTGSFSANHSYYDSSMTEEYFSNDTSYRVYPFFSDQINKISMYPIMSPSKLEIKLYIYLKNKTKIEETYKLISPSSKPVHININDIATQKNVPLTDIATFSIFAKNLIGSAPTRINHQLIYGSLEKMNPINSSINVSLMNDQVFKAKNKGSHIWGQMINSKDYKSQVGFNFINPEGDSAEIDFEFYNSNGLINSYSQKLSSRRSIIISSSDILTSKKNFDFIWYLAKSKRSDLAAFFTHSNKISGHSSGDHHF